jgi:beta-aspartyl-peptidase (threonine type)
MRKVSRIVASLLAVLAMMTAAAATQATQSPSATAGAKSDAETAIRAELDAQVAAWNRGDLKGYMQGYWQSPELTFFAGDSESAGWEAAYLRYRAAYLGKGKEMGRLTFSNLRVDLLGPDAAFVRGSWQVTLKNGSQRRGLFTIVLKKLNEGWRIIHDHSS